MVNWCWVDLSVNCHAGLWRLKSPNRSYIGGCSPFSLEDAITKLLNIQGGEVCSTSAGYLRTNTNTPTCSCMRCQDSRYSPPFSAVFFFCYEASCSPVYQHFSSNILFPKAGEALPLLHCRHRLCFCFHLLVGLSASVLEVHFHYRYYQFLFLMGMAA